MELQNWFYLATICFLGACSPGPSLLVVLGFVSTEGKRSGISVSIGHGLGVFFYALLSTLGLSVLIVNYYLAFTVVQIIGALFLIWIAFRIIINISSYNVENDYYSKKIERKNRFFEGILVAILNPKIAVFFISLFSQFLSPDQTVFTHMLMAVLAGGIDTVVYCVIVLFASTQKVSRLMEKYKKQVSLIFGLLLILLAFSLFFSLV